MILHLLLCDIYSKNLFAIISNLIKETGDAEDSLQEVLDKFNPQFMVHAKMLEI